MPRKSDPRLESRVQRLRAADEAHAGHPETPLLQGLLPPRRRRGGRPGPGSCWRRSSAPQPCAVVTCADCGEVSSRSFLYRPGGADLVVSVASAPPSTFRTSGCLLSAGVSQVGQEGRQDQSRHVARGTPPTPRAARRRLLSSLGREAGVMTEADALRAACWLLCKHGAHPHTRCRTSRGRRCP